MKKTFECFVLCVAVLALASVTLLAQTATVPGVVTCNPCLFYGGDSTTFNGLANEKDIIVPDAEVLVPFDVPESQEWKVTGLFTNDLSNVNVIDPPKAQWSIRKDVRAGHCGTVIASGNSAATFKPTGRSGYGDREYTTLTKIKPVVLPPGRYWLTTVPECTNVHDSNCTNNTRYFATAFTGKPKHAYGPEEPCDAFFNSKFFGTHCERVTDRKHCARFSAGVLGTK